MAIEEHHTVRFDEAYYLAQNPDVANAVKIGNFRTGFDHYRTIGKAEGRAPAQSSDQSGTPNALEDLLIVAVKSRFEPLLRKYLEDNSAAVLDSIAPRFREMMDETLPNLLDGAVRAEVDRAIKAQPMTRS